MKDRKEIDDKFKWNVNLIIKNDKEYQEKKEKAKLLINKIIDFKGKILESAKNLLEYLKIKDDLDKIIRDLYVYVNLQRYEDLSSQKAIKKSMEIDEVLNDLDNKLSFVNSELSKIDEEKMNKFIKEEKELNTYRFILENIIRSKKHILNEDEESLVSLLTSSYGTTEKIFDILNDSEENIGIVEIDGENVKITQSNYITLLKNKDPKIRKKIFKTYYDFYRAHKNTISSLYALNVSEDVNIGKVRKFDNSLEMALDSENINHKVYENLLSKVNDNLDLIHEFQKLKNKLLGIQKPHMYDNYLEYGIQNRDDYDIDKCKEIILSALSPLGEDYIKKCRFMFDSQYIDYYPTKNKRSGAFQWHRFVLLNHMNTYDSLTTMAHELGHAINTLYTEESVPFVYQENPIFLAEIASTCNEVLVNHYLYQNVKTKEEKISLLMDFLTRVNATIYRQTQLAEFEYIAHNAKENNIPLTCEYMCDKYYNLVNKYMDESIIKDEEIKYEWMRIPHFYTSFYVYKYAIGLICSLIFANRILNGDEKAKNTYIKFLSRGYSDYPLNILKEANIDLNDKSVFDEAFDLIKIKIDELKEVIESE